MPTGGTGCTPASRDLTTPSGARTCVEKRIGPGERVARRSSPTNRPGSSMPSSSVSSRGWPSDAPIESSVFAARFARSIRPRMSISSVGAGLLSTNVPRSSTCGESVGGDSERTFPNGPARVRERGETGDGFPSHLYGNEMPPGYGATACMIKSAKKENGGGPQSANRHPHFAKQQRDPPSSIIDPQRARSGCVLANAQAAPQSSALLPSPHILTTFGLNRATISTRSSCSRITSPMFL